MTIMANIVGNARQTKLTKRDRQRLVWKFVNNLGNNREINSENGDLIDLYLSRRSFHCYFNF